MKKDIKSVVSANIRRLRSEVGLTQEALASKTGLSIRYLIKIQNDPTNLTIESLESLAKALGVPLVEFFREMKTQTIPQRKFNTQNEALEFAISVLKAYRE